MIRLLMVFVGLAATVMATVAGAQSYPQPYPAQQAAYGYGQQMPPGQYAPAGYPGPQQYGGMPGMYGQPQGPQAQYEAAQAIYYQRQMQAQAAAGPPSKPKLPPGVHEENGLLYFNGPAYGNLGYQQMPGYNPYQQVAYQQAMQGGPGMAGPGMNSVMSQGGPNGLMMQGRQMMQGSPTMGGQMMPGGQMSGQDDGNCDGGNCNCDDGGAACQHHYCWFHHGLFPGKDGYVWSGGYDNLLMTRDAGSNRVLAQNVNTLDTEFDSHQMHFDPSYGGRAFVQLMGPSGIAYQGVYMKLATLVADASIAGADDLQIPFPLAASTTDYFGANQMLFHYTSAIQGGEANVIYPWGSVQLIAGFRYLEIDESFKLTSVNNVTAGTSDIPVDAFNQMFGGQIGFQSQWSLFDLVNFDLMAKFAVFGNRTAERQVIYDLNNTVIVRDTSGRNASTAYLGELAAQGVIPLGQTFSFHAGYSVMFINQIALAPDQLDTTDQIDSGTHVDSRGDIILHGVNVGLTAVW